MEKYEQSWELPELIKKAKPGKTTRPWGIPAPLLYQEEGN
jgi:hypothetical protein